jgi:hypothetical protein
MSENYQSPVHQLLAVGDPRGRRDWPDYPSEFGLAREQVPELIRMATDEGLLWADSESAEVWAPVHAWRTLGQLGAVEAAEPLFDLLRQIDEEQNDWISEELPEVYGLLGPQAIPVVAAYLQDPSHGLWSRFAAGRAIGRIGVRHPEAREECITVLTGALEQHADNDPGLNGCLISELMELKAVEALPAIRAAFESGSVDELVPGDLEDVEIHLGVRSRRATPAPYRALLQRQLGTVLDLVAPAAPDWARVGRNDPCPCGSGLKFKKCCLGKTRGEGG